MKRYIITRTTTIVEKTSVGIDSETYAIAYAEREFGDPNGDKEVTQSIETTITTLLQSEANQEVSRQALEELAHQ